MSLDTAIIPEIGQKQEVAEVVEPKGYVLSRVISLKNDIRQGRCPYYDSCQHPSKAPNYYCLESRHGLIRGGQIICYLAPEPQENKQ